MYIQEETQKKNKTQMRTPLYNIWKFYNWSLPSEQPHGGFCSCENFTSSGSSYKSAPTPYIPAQDPLEHRQSKTLVNVQFPSSSRISIDVSFNGLGETNQPNPAHSRDSLRVCSYVTVTHPMYDVMELPGVSFRVQVLVDFSRVRLVDNWRQWLQWWLANGWRCMAV